MVINKKIITTQRTYKDWDTWINENIPGINYADRIENLCENWKKTHGKTYMEMISKLIMEEQIIPYIDKRFAEEEKLKGEQNG